MSSILLYFFIAVGLSMDAFSLAILYGTNGFSMKKSMILSTNVGILHFIMPNLGNLLGKSFLKGFIFCGNIITGIVFLFLSVQMIMSFNEKEDTNNLEGYIELFLFAIAVSISSCPIKILINQKAFMGNYLKQLEIRAEIENIDLSQF